MHHFGAMMLLNEGSRESSARHKLSKLLKLRFTMEKMSFMRWLGGLDSLDKMLFSKVEVDEKVDRWLFKASAKKTLSLKEFDKERENFCGWIPFFPLSF